MAKGNFNNTKKVNVDMAPYYKIAKEITNANTWSNDIPEENIAIKIENLSKMYKIYDKSWYRVLNAFTSKVSYKEFYALKNLNINIPKGETIGILGTNGSGKSTLLKMVTGVVKPTNGTIDAKGRISAMLELTSGFDSELTGYENIFLKATILGIPNEEIEKRVESIAEFADIGDYLYQPVRTYSSGMKSRLGFAINVNVNPDILIVDEVLAVGDDTFKLKCLSKMDEFRKEGKTILFVSHALGMIKGFCTKAMWIKDGELIVQGETSAVTKLYEDYLKDIRKRKKIQTIEEKEEEAAELILSKTDILNFRHVRIINPSNAPNNTTDFKYRDNIVFEVEYDVKTNIENDMVCCFSIRDISDNEIFSTDKQDKNNMIDISKGRHIFRFVIPSSRLLPGAYKIAGEFWDNIAGMDIKFATKRDFTIISDKFEGGGVYSIPYIFEKDDKTLIERVKEGSEIESCAYNFNIEME